MMRAMAAKLSRRQLALASVAAAGMPADNTTSVPSDKALDPVLWSRMRHGQAPLQLTFKARSRREAEAWQRQLRGKLTELLGGFPRERAALAPEPLETREFPSYRRERVLFTSRPGVKVAAWVLTPKNSAGPHPVMICIRMQIITGCGPAEFFGVSTQAATFTPGRLVNSTRSRR